MGQKVTADVEVHLGLRVHKGCAVNKDGKATKAGQVLKEFPVHKDRVDGQAYLVPQARMEGLG